ncbi:MAG: FAD/NAD(P)-binding protein [Pseudomonadota bacterium]
MTDKTTRRDFLNGTRIAIGASLIGPWTEAFGRDEKNFQLPSGYYPPLETGLRGSHEGAWQAMHARVAGARWETSSIDDDVDLVVVGGGISGLAAANFYRRKHPDARILVLDNHDDFGGHAKRNEFDVNGRRQIAYGGTEAIDTPSSYASVSSELLKDIGVNVERFYDYYDQDLYDDMSLSYGIAFDAKTYGQRKLVTGYGTRPWAEFVADTPLTDKAKADLLRAFTDERDYLPNMSRDEKIALLRRVSYREYLADYVKVDEQVLEIYQRWGMSYWCVGMDEIPAIDILKYGDGGYLPGFEYTIQQTEGRGAEPYIFHFPDGNATIARLLVRQLIPTALPGKTMEDSVLAKLDYTQLDRPDATVRIRLNSTVVNAAHSTDEQSVRVTYVHGNDTHAIRAKHCVMACYNSAIPYLCPELPEAQKNGLSYNVKIPLVYTKVIVPNWRAFAEQDLRYVFYTNDFYKQVELDYPVSLGGYEFGADPDQPMSLHMCHVPYFADIQGPTQWRAGRQQLLETPFSTYEFHVRDQLHQALGNAGFDAENDIEAITVNRWAHGYSYSPDLLWEPEYANDADKPWVIGRQPFGRIAIANSDAGASADTNTAISQAYRAVAELVGG